MIRPIQYLRGIAAMMVVWHHSLIQVAGTTDFIRIPEFGYLGVDLFFVISGFIMVFTTFDKPVTPLQFIGNRIRRIVPLYWTATLAMIALAIAFPSLFKSLQFNTAAVVKSLLFIPHESLSDPGIPFPVLKPGWTLDYEMFFYALFAASLFLAKPLRIPLMIGTMVTLVAAGIFLPHTSMMAFVYTSPKLLEFGVGMIFGRLWVMRKHVRRDVEGNAVLMALGDASYSIYLSHLFTLGVLRIIWVRMVPAATMTSSIMLMAASMVVCAIAGWLCYRWIERPLSKWISNRRLNIRIEVFGERA